ncbi:MAG TPA: hypothetical protein VJM08_17450, partial [Anaerolineales bacterium]|nr:hypothetical protein [Anaerolineales bacterium]
YTSMIKQKEKIIWIVVIAFLTACGNEAAALPPETSIPTVVSPTFIPTSTFIPITITPSPLPTQPIIPMITPDAIQVERWKEYEDALAQSLLSFLPPEEVICEWEILGRSEQEVYVWALCTSIISSGTSPISGAEIFSSSSTPAVIHLREDGSVQSVEKPGSGSKRISNILKMFPPDVQEKFENYHFGRAGAEIGERLVWRRKHPDEPPLIVLSATQTP